MSGHGQGAGPPGASLLGACAVAASSALCVALSACYAIRPDSCAAVTVWPVWAWPIPGLLLSALASGARRRVASRVLLGAWALFVLVFAEEPWSLARGILHPARQLAEQRAAPGALRIVSLNCAGGSPNAAAEVAGYHPDIVLLQESPPRTEVERLAHTLFGADGVCAWGPDGSVLARGPGRPTLLAREQGAFSAAARVRLSGGHEAAVVSVRLLPPVFREDLWNPSCWRDQAANRRARRSQVRVVAAFVRSLPAGLPVILGGDLNAPAGDGALRPLRQRLSDAFPSAGRGWGDTIISEIPALRIDQVWLSSQLEPLGVWARRTAHSDHRMVICDVWLRGP